MRLCESYVFSEHIEWTISFICFVRINANITCKFVAVCRLAQWKHVRYSMRLRAANYSREATATYMKQTRHNKKFGLSQTESTTVRCSRLRLDTMRGFHSSRSESSFRRFPTTARIGTTKPRFTVWDVPSSNYQDVLLISPIVVFRHTYSDVEIKEQILLVREQF